MTISRNAYLEWVQDDLRALAASKFPNNPQQQMLYQIGFLQRMLADAMWDDSRVSNSFVRSVRSAANRERRLAGRV